MPNLTKEAVHKFWHSYDDPMVYRVVCFMESIEEWTKDGDADIEAAMKELGSKLDDLKAVNVGDLEQDDNFIRIACNIKTGRALRLLQALDTVQPGAASKLLIHAEEKTESNSDAHGIFLRRNIVFERLRLLARIFSAERFSMALSAADSEDI